MYEGRGWTNRVSFLRKEPPIDNPDQTFDIGMVGDYKKEERSGETINFDESLISTWSYFMHWL